MNSSESNKNRTQIFTMERRHVSHIIEKRSNSLESTNTDIGHNIRKYTLGHPIIIEPSYAFLNVLCLYQVNPLAYVCARAT